jgi:hypothetical protein
MKPKPVIHFLVFLGGLAGVVAAAEETVPPGWDVPRSSQDFAVFVDRNVGRTGRASGSVKARVAQPEGEGMMMQTFAVGFYRGKRIRMSGYLKTADATAAQLWMRVEGADQILASDNMANRAFTGTVDWVKCELVLEVSPEAINITIGCLLRGTGQLWFDDLRFEIVGKGVPVTDASGELAKAGKADDRQGTDKLAPRFKPARSTRPRNLGFEERS